MIKKVVGWVTPLKLVIGLALLGVCAVIFFLAASRNSAEFMDDIDVSLSPAFTVEEGDVLTLRVAATEVSDLYGYQFRLEYDDTLLSVGAPQSLIESIPTIFKKDFDGYALIGATMIGDTPGYSAAGPYLCELKLTVLFDGVFPEIKLSKVGAVSSQLDYIENISGWTYEIMANTQGS